MPIIINVDVMLAKRKMQSQELAEKIGITQANLVNTGSDLQSTRLPTRRHP